MCEVRRFATALERSHSLRAKLFTEREAAGRRVESLAARFAAKEALAKALGAPGDLLWHDAEVLRDPQGPPRLALRGTVLARATALGVGSAHLSLSHDGGLATAFVVLEG